jgi:hypothetical protein
MRLSLFVILLSLLALASAGCQSSTPQTTESVRNAEGELEGKEPQFKMVPAQGQGGN